MASKTKYAPAPTQDPDEASSYAQAPPAYQAEPTAASDTDRLFGGGAPRSSQDDDLPDDFKVSTSTSTVLSRHRSSAPGYPVVPLYLPIVNQLSTNTSNLQFGGSVAEATTDIRNQFIRKVYAILTVQLIATGAVSALSFFSNGYKTWIQAHPGLVFASVRFPVPFTRRIMTRLTTKHSSSAPSS